MFMHTFDSEFAVNPRLGIARILQGRHNPEILDAIIQRVTILMVQLNRPFFIMNCPYEVISVIEPVAQTNNMSTAVQPGTLGTSSLFTGVRLVPGNPTAIVG